MKESKISSMVAEYEGERPLYEAYTKKIEELIKALLEESNTQVHSVTSRTKEIDRFTEKVKLEGKEYKKSSDVTDLSGVRIICYFFSQVDELAEIIKSHFIVHQDLSIDKRKTLDPDRFGYLSLHYVVELSEARTGLPEYERFKNLLCEVQIRSILQHAWAEIEHDLGYKSSIEVPRDIRRRFSRLASLLELGDEEFDGIKSDIASYVDMVASRMSSEPEKIMIDKVSLTHYLRTSPVIKEMAKAIADFLETEVIEESLLWSKDVESLRYYEIQTIDELDERFKGKKEKIIAFAKEWLKSHKGSLLVDTEMPLMLLIWVCGGETQDYDAVLKYIKSLKISEVNPPHQKRLAKEVIDTYKKILS
ncbi:hypothetical protein C5S32_00255 [ANME-1 cluster archaeon GoMg1]|nr:hypothetical protein [ANME-1 cluster archaeon GoMg1]